RCRDHGVDPDDRGHHRRSPDRAGGGVSARRRRQTYRSINPPAGARSAAIPAPSAQVRREPARLLTDRNVLFALIAGAAIYRFAMLSGNPGPPGLDGGNWLAFTNMLFGQNAKAAASTYFPGALVSLKVLLIFLPPLTALKVFAVTTGVL